MPFDSKYNGAALEKRLDQGYYDDLVAAGIAAGLYTAETAPTKADLDKMIAGSNIYMLTLPRTILSEGINVTQQLVDELTYAFNLKLPVFVLIEGDANNLANIFPTFNFAVNTGTNVISMRVLTIYGLSLLTINIPTLAASIRTAAEDRFAMESTVLLKRNTISFTPTDDYNPATKKYVDDNTKAITVLADNTMSAEDFSRLIFLARSSPKPLAVSFTSTGKVYSVINCYEKTGVGDGGNHIIFAISELKWVSSEPIISYNTYEATAQGGDATVTLDRTIEIKKSFLDYLSFMISKKIVTTLTNLPGDAANIIANVSAATNLTHSGLAEPSMQTIRVNNTTAADITQVLPTTGIYESMMGPSVVIPANSYIELSLWMIDGKISIRTGEQA